jgi:hypothetical protein
VLTPPRRTGGGRRRPPTRSLVIAAMAATVVAAGAWPVPAIADVPVSAVGWWTNAAVKPSPPNGGIAVSIDPSGSTSTAAIRINTGAGGVSRATLQLTEASGEGQQVATLQACAADNSWKPVQGGNLSDAPKASCTTSVQLARSASGVWQADIYPLLSGQTGSVSIAIVPGPPPSGLPAGVFQLDFQPPVVQGEVVAATNTAPAAPLTSAPQSSPGGSPASAPAAAAPAPAAGATTSNLPAVNSAAPASQLPAQVQAPSLSPSANSQATNRAEATGAPSTNGDFTAHFPAAGSAASAKKAISTATVLFWLAMALVIGSVAGGLHWARAEKMLPSLPWRRRANLFERPL